MRGLPDSAVYGTYKRLNRKRRVKAQTSWLDVFNEWLEAYEAKVKEEATRRKIRGY
jgi:hypothetical protein